jgi:hypothetical protein
MVKSRRIRWTGYAVRMGEKRNGCRILLRKTEGRKPPGRRWVDNIKMALREIELDCIDWIHLAQDKDQWPTLMNKVMNIRVP